MKVMTLMGTRPEMIKMWSVLKLLDQLSFDHIMVHTSQNFTKELKDFFFRDLELRAPDYDLKIDTSSYSNEVADVIKKSGDLMAKVKPDALIILGDTYSGLSVLPAKNQGIKIFHMEAGLRAWDNRMPEQTNRILIDHIADYCLPFYSYHRENLLRENIHPSKIFVTGNPTFEVMRAFQPQINQSDILSKLSLTAKDYFSVTIHRKENVDDPKSLHKIIESLAVLVKRYQKEVVYPMHPRTQSKISKKELLDRGIKVIDPLGFYDFNQLNKNAFCLLGDSGTTPEEGLFYGIPCVSIRKTSERYETVEAGSHIIAGIEPDNIILAVDTITRQTRRARYDFEEGFSSANAVINVINSQITNYF